MKRYILLKEEQDFKYKMDDVGLFLKLIVI